MRALAAAAAALVLVLAAGCSATPVRVRNPAVSPEYKRAVQSHSSVRRIYTQFTPRVEVSATFETRDFKVARQNELARIKAIPEGQMEVRVEPTIVVFIDSTLAADEDLTDRTPTFRVVLESAGRQWEPVRVENLDVSDTTLKFLFPYFHAFGTAYRLVLPTDAPLERGAATLVVAGPPGTLRMPFE